MENKKDIPSNSRANTDKWLKLWMRIIGALYLFLFIAAALLKLPIKVLAPEGTLSQASAGDPLSMFLVDTWVILGLAIGSIGLALLLASRIPSRAKVLVQTVIGFELIWGIGSDIYQILRGHNIEKILPWIVIHIIIITTGITVLRKTQKTDT